MLREAVGLYRAVRQHPAQLETMLDAAQASVALSGELKVASVPAGVTVGVLSGRDKLACSLNRLYFGLEHVSYVGWS